MQLIYFDQLVSIRLSNRPMQQLHKFFIHIPTNNLYLHICTCEDIHIFEVVLTQDLFFSFLVFLSLSLPLSYFPLLYIFSFYNASRRGRRQYTFTYLYIHLHMYCEYSISNRPTCVIKDIREKVQCAACI